MSDREEYKDPAIGLLVKQHVHPYDRIAMIAFLVEYGNYPSVDTIVRLAEMGAAVSEALANTSMIINTVDNKPVGFSDEAFLQSLASMCRMVARQQVRREQEVAS